MIFNKDIAKKTAEVLLQVNAIKLSPKAPFTWALVGNHLFIVITVLFYRFRLLETMFAKLWLNI